MENRYRVYQKMYDWSAKRRPYYEQRGGPTDTYERAMAMAHGLTAREPKSEVVVTREQEVATIITLAGPESSNDMPSVPTDDQQGAVAPDTESQKEED